MTKIVLEVLSVHGLLVVFFPSLSLSVSRGNCQFAAGMKNRHNEDEEKRHNKVREPII